MNLRTAGYTTKHNDTLIRKTNNFFVEKKLKQTKKQTRLETISSDIKNPFSTKSELINFAK